MTSNFVETAKSRTAKRTYNKIENIDDFEAGIANFLADESMAITRKAASTSSYKVKVEYFDAAGDDKGYINCYAADKTAYNDMASLLTGTEAAETAAVVGGSASRDSEDDTWSVKSSCEKEEDTFIITFTREYIHVTGFAEDAMDDLELVAVITAAIAASMGTSTDGFVVRSIRRAGKSRWKNAI